MIDEDAALKEIKLLRPKHDDILVFHLHRKPSPDDVEVVNKVIRKLPAQVLVFLLGPEDTVEQIAKINEAELQKNGLMLIPPTVPA